MAKAAVEMPSTAAPCRTAATTRVARYRFQAAAWAPSVKANVWFNAEVYGRLATWRSSTCLVDGTKLVSTNRCIQPLWTSDGIGEIRTQSLGSRAVAGKALSRKCTTLPVDFWK